MNGIEVGLQDKSIFADIVSKLCWVNLSQGLVLCKIDDIHNNILVIAVAKLFLDTKNRKMKGFIHSSSSPLNYIQYNQFQ